MEEGAITRHSAGGTKNLAKGRTLPRKEGTGRLVNAGQKMGVKEGVRNLPASEGKKRGRGCPDPQRTQRSGSGKKDLDPREGGR